MSATTPSMRVRANFACLVACSALAGCLTDPDVGWDRFNATADALVVDITASGPPGDPVRVDLLSTTGAFVVAEAFVTPGSGPVGTEHRVVVRVAEDYEDVVDRVTVSGDSGERGVERFELVRDSAEPGYWERLLTSTGVEGEVREDIFRFGLWREVEEPATPDTGGDAS